MAEEKKKSGFLSSLGKLGGKSQPQPAGVKGPVAPPLPPPPGPSGPSQPDPGTLARIEKLEKALAAVQVELAEVKKEAARPKTDSAVTAALSSQAKKLEQLEASFKGLEEIKASDRLNAMLEKVLEMESKFSVIEKGFPQLRNEVARLMDDYKDTALRLKAQVLEAGSEAMSLKAALAAVEEKASALEARFGPALELLLEEQEKSGRSLQKGFAEARESLTRSFEERYAPVREDLGALASDLKSLRSDWKLALETRLRHAEAKASAFDAMSSRFETLLEEVSRLSGRAERHKK